MTVNVYSFSFLFVFMVGTIIFALNYSHLLKSLLSLEILGLMILSMMCMFVCFYNSSFFFCLMFMMSLVMESVIGLSMLVFMSSSQGNDYLYNMHISLC